jgi:hypothetical protein
MRHIALRAPSFQPLPEQILHSVRGDSIFSPVVKALRLE